MPEIGPTLREARMRARIDITEVEQATKIRAKYLRAIENEEWSLLPGSTFVKSFIREYADFLGLDARSLVEEYKLRYERPSESEMRSISPGIGPPQRSGRGGGRGPMGGPRRGVPPWVVLGGVLLVLVAALWAVGTLFGGDDGDGGDTPTTTQATRRRTSRGANARRQARRRQQQRQAVTPPTQAGVRIVPTGDVYVCLVDGDGRVLIPGTIYAAGEQVPVQRARILRMTLGNGNAQLRANGRAVEVTPSSTAIGFEITPTSVRPLAAEAQPTCT